MSGLLSRSGMTKAAVAALWVSCLSIGMLLLTKTAGKPGTQVEAPPNWPKGSSIVPNPNEPTLVMFAHPRCSCTRASLAELDRLLAQSPTRVCAHVVFIQPTETDQNWTGGELWRTAEKIPGVQVHADAGGVEAQRFNVETSGDVLLYGADAILRFHGGITMARGHEGDNAGRSAILAILKGKKTQSSGLVFGCALFDSPPPTNNTPRNK